MEGEDIYIEDNRCFEVARSIELPQAMACTCVTPVTLQTKSVRAFDDRSDLAYHMGRTSLVMLNAIISPAILAGSFDLDLAGHTLCMLVRQTHVIEI